MKHIFKSKEPTVNLLAVVGSINDKSTLYFLGTLDQILDKEDTVKWLHLPTDEFYHYYSYLFSFDIAYEAELPKVPLYNPEVLRTKISYYAVNKPDEQTVVGSIILDKLSYDQSLFVNKYLDFKSGSRRINGVDIVKEVAALLDSYSFKQDANMGNVVMLDLIWSTRGKLNETQSTT